MKKFKMLAATIIMVALATAGFAQTTADYHKALSSHHEKAKIYVDAIVTGTSRTKLEHLKNMEEATKCLDEAKQSHATLKNSIPAKHKEAAKEYHVAIEKNHETATKHIAAINLALKKKTPNETKVKEQAKKLSASIEKAEAEHQALKTKIL
jgi:hypothetical protein